MSESSIVRPRARERLDFNRCLRASALAQMGDYVRAVKEADDVATQEGSYGFNLGCVYSRCSAAVDKDTKPSSAERAKLKEQYAIRAIAFLRQDKELDVYSARNDPDLAPMRDREDFKKLVRDLEKQTKTGAEEK